MKLGGRRSLNLLARAEEKGALWRTGTPAGNATETVAWQGVRCKLVIAEAWLLYDAGYGRGQEARDRDNGRDTGRPEALSIREHEAMSGPAFDHRGCCDLR